MMRQGPGPRTRAPDGSREQPTLALVSLGCPKNLVDSEGMAEILSGMGFRPAGGLRGADVVLINTCTFIKDAAEESLEAISEALELKRDGAVGVVVVAGCLVQRMGRRLMARFPDLDGALGTGSWPQVGRVCREALEGTERSLRLDPPGRTVLLPGRTKSSHGHFAYLKITEGCHRRCSYCIIPSVRGPLLSAPPDALLREAGALVRSGVVELILVGEDTGAYGADVDGRWSLTGLLSELNSLPGLGWIRLMYVHPCSVNDRLIATIEECDKVCAYMDVPIQHASDRVLSAMNRPTSKKNIERVLRSLKDSPKDFALRTTVMVGFPGETQSDFEELKAFVSEWEFDHLGAFCYSPEGGTKAASYPAQVDDAVTANRRSEIMEAQAKISLKKNRAVIGSAAEVLVDEISGDGGLPSRTRRQAPGVDGITLVSGAAAGPGELLTVSILDADEYDLYAAPAAGRRS